MLFLKKSNNILEKTNKPGITTFKILKKFAKKLKRYNKIVK